jgi:hypothetical protein
VEEDVEMSAAARWREVRPDLWTLEDTAVELRQENRPVPLPSGRSLFRQTPDSWSVYVDEGADLPSAVTFTLEEAKRVAEAELGARFDKGGDA